MTATTLTPDAVQTATLGCPVRRFGVPGIRPLCALQELNISAPGRDETTGGLVFFMPRTAGRPPPAFDPAAHDHLLVTLRPGAGVVDAGAPAVQTAIAAVISVTLAFRPTGRDHGAAVLSAGFAGFALGAAPTATADMTAATGRHGHAPLSSSCRWCRRPASTSPTRRSSRASLRSLCPDA